MACDHLDMLQVSFGIIYAYPLKNYLHEICSKMSWKEIIYSHILQLGCNVFLMVCILSFLFLLFFLLFTNYVFFAHLLQL